uniref:ATP-dependent RNA helicase n=1 Tax=Chelonoidis abingdonii TaxID=106734 RepID=A0A8C0GGE2_CHEAB
MKQSKALKRKLQWADEGTPAKQKPKLSVSPIKKCTKEADICVKRNLSSKSPPKKDLTDRQNESLRSRPFIKTSCLFKNNPKIPEIHRGGVKQVQEKVFTSDSFSQLDLHPHLVSARLATSVQKQTIPVLLKGKDALVRSQTGSGHSWCILLNGTLLLQRSDGPYALILVPTREPFTWIVPGVLMGGEKRKSEKARLRKGINILISTPGRLVDHIKSTKCIHFRRIQWLIMDEADRILDMGFEKDVTVILNALNAESERRQNVLLSATLTKGVTRLADISLHDPVSIAIVEETWDRTTPEQEAIGSPAHMEEGGFAIPEKLKQLVVVVPSKLRLVTLAAFILGKCKFEKHHKMIIFFSSCEQVEFHYKLLLKVLLGGQEAEEPECLPLSSSHLKFLRLHGNMEQEVMHCICLYFLSTRGLDLPQVTWIVQYNAPASPAEYIHRIGRTARIDCHGNSLLILTPSEAEYVNSLASHKINVSEMKMEDILSSLMKDDRFKGRRWGTKKSRGTNPQEVRERATVLQTEFENYVHSGEGTVQWAKKALQSFLRSYTTYPKTLKHIFHIKSLHLGHVAKSFGLRDAPQNLSASMAASSGKKTKLQPKRLNCVMSARHSAALRRGRVACFPMNLLMSMQRERGAFLFGLLGSLPL